MRRWDGVSVKSQLLPYFSDFWEEFAQYTPLGALLNRNWELFGTDKFDTDNKE